MYATHQAHAIPATAIWGLHIDTVNWRLSSAKMTFRLNQMIPVVIIGKSPSQIKPFIFGKPRETGRNSDNGYEGRS